MEIPKAYYQNHLRSHQHYPQSHHRQNHHCRRGLFLRLNLNRRLLM
jgi:hypothetical protein